MQPFGQVLVRGEFEEVCAKGGMRNCTVKKTEKSPVSAAETKPTKNTYAGDSSENASAVSLAETASSVPAQTFLRQTHFYLPQGSRKSQTLELPD